MRGLFHSGISLNRSRAKSAGDRPALSLSIHHAASQPCGSREPPEAAVAIDDNGGDVERSDIVTK